MNKNAVCVCVWWNKQIIREEGEIIRLNKYIRGGGFLHKCSTKAHLYITSSMHQLYLAQFSFLLSLVQYSGFFTGNVAKIYHNITSSQLFLKSLLCHKRDKKKSEGYKLHL